ncbi:hypothetical protein pb186bvf_002354 [Paramecium bursaria]
MWRQIQDGQRGYKIDKKFQYIYNNQYKNMERQALNLLHEIMLELPQEGYTEDEITYALKTGLNLTTNFKYPDKEFNELSSLAYRSHLVNSKILSTLHQQCQYICQPKKSQNKKKAPQILEQQPDLRPKTPPKKKINNLFIEIPKENQQLKTQTTEFNDDIIVIDSNDDEKKYPSKSLNHIVIPNPHEQIRLETPTQSVSKADVQFTFTTQQIKSPQKKVDNEELISRKKQVVKDQKSNKKITEISQNQLNQQQKFIAEPKPKVQQQKQKPAFIPIEKKKIDKPEKKQDKRLPRQALEIGQEIIIAALIKQQFLIHDSVASNISPLTIVKQIASQIKLSYDQQNGQEKKQQRQDITPVEIEIQKKQKNDISKNGQKPIFDFDSVLDIEYQQKQANAPTQQVERPDQQRRQISSIILQQPKKPQIIKAVKIQENEQQTLPLKAAGFKLRTNCCTQCDEEQQTKEHLLLLNEQNKLCYKCCLDGLNPFTRINQKIGVLEYKVEERQTKKQKINFTVDVLQILSQPSNFMRGMKVEIRCVQLQPPKGLSEITFPQNCKLYLNDQLLKQFDPLQEKSCLKKRKDKPIFLSLADLGKFVNNLNGLCFSVDETFIMDSKYRKDQKGQCYYFGLYISEPHRPEQLIEDLLRKKTPTQIIKQKFDPDLAIMRTNVTLTCIYDLKLIHIPARGAYCEHQQCFSITNFLEMQMIAQDGQKWYCPICKMSCFHLVIDKYQLKLLERVRQLGLQMDSLELLPDGQLDPTIEIQRVLLDEEVSTFEQAIQKGYKIQVAKEISDDEEDQPVKNKEKIEIIID